MFGPKKGWLDSILIVFHAVTFHFHLIFSTLKKPLRIQVCPGVERRLSLEEGSEFGLGLWGCHN